MYTYTYTYTYIYIYKIEHEVQKKLIYNLSIVVVVKPYFLYIFYILYEPWLVILLAFAT